MIADLAINAHSEMATNQVLTVSQIIDDQPKLEQSRQSQNLYSQSVANDLGQSQKSRIDSSLSSKDNLRLEQQI